MQCVSNVHGVGGVAKPMYLYHLYWVFVYSRLSGAAIQGMLMNFSGSEGLLALLQYGCSWGEGGGGMVGEVDIVVIMM